MKGLGVRAATVYPAGKGQKWGARCYSHVGRPHGLASFGHVCSPRPWPARVELGLGGRPDCGRRGPRKIVSAHAERGSGGAAQAKLCWALIDVCTHGPSVCERGPRVAGSPVPAKIPSGRVLTV